MPRTYVRTEQVSGSITFNDAQTTGHAMIQSGSLRTLDDDLNNLRTILKTVAGEDNWYEDVSAVGGVQRNLKELHTHLDALMSGSRPHAGTLLEGNFQQKDGTTFDVDTSGAITLDSTGAGISLDAAAASNFTVVGSDLTLSGSQGLKLGAGSGDLSFFDDDIRTAGLTDGLLFSSGSNDVNNFMSRFTGSQESVLAAINHLHDLASNSHLSKQVYIASGSITSGTPIETIALTEDDWNNDRVLVYLNGVLQRSGSNGLHDVYRDGTNLKFNFEIEDGDFIAVTSGSIGGGLTTAAGGGSTSPGGSDTHIQFNDGGSFAGDSGLVFNKTTDSLTAAGNITGSIVYATSHMTASYGAFGTGSMPASGHIRLPSNSSIVARNAPNTDDIQILQLDSDDVLHIGDGAVNPDGLTIDTQSSVTFRIAQTYELALFPTYLDVVLPSIIFRNTESSPTLKQGDSTGASKGETLTIQAQNSSAVSSEGGNLFLKAGTGTSDNGHVQLSGSVVSVTGSLVKPTQPAFLVRKSTNNQDNIAVGSAVDVTLDEEDFDIGSNFASNTFTAPITGVYIFTANVYLTGIDATANSYALDLVTSPGTYRLAIIDPRGFDTDVNTWTLNGSMPVSLTAGQTAKIQVTQAGGSAQTDIRGSSTRGTFFSGYLLG